MLKVVILVVFGIASTNANFVPVKQCPSTEIKTHKLCEETCMALQERYLRRHVKDRGDFADLQKVNRVCTSRMVYTKSNDTLSWWFNDNDLKWVKSKSEDIKVTAFFVPDGHNLSRPAIATCCGIPLSRKTCKVEVTEKGGLYFGLQLRADMLGIVHKIFEFDPSPVETCFKVMNNTYLMCVWKGIITFKKVVHDSTSVDEWTEDQIRAEMLPGCSYKISEAQAREFGVEIEEHITKDYFKRRIWNVTGYHSDARANINCSGNGLKVAKNATYDVSEGDVICFLYGSNKAKPDHFCMAGQEEKMPDDEITRISDTNDVALAVGLSVLGLILLLVFGCLGRKFGARAKKVVISWREIPESINKMGNTLKDEPLEFSSMVEKEVADTFVPGKALELPVQSSRSEEMSLLENHYIEDDPVPVEGDYIIRNDSRPPSATEASQVDSCIEAETKSCSSIGDGQETSARYARMQTSDRSSESSSSDQVDAGTLTPIPRRVDHFASLSCKDVPEVSQLGLMIEDIDGPPPGTEELICQTLFLKMNETSLSGGARGKELQT